MFSVMIHCLFAQNDTLRVVPLQEVLVRGSSKSKIIERQAIKTTIVGVDSFRLQTATLTELMNRAVGIRVQQVGGLGASTNLIINGFGGKAIKYFKDGIPVDYLGPGFNLSTIPVNQIKRIEVYKGILPISLGADALGGGVNVVTAHKMERRSVDMSYQYGSFNTHRMSLSISATDASGHFFVGMDGSYNHSDNNYTVTVPVLDAETAVKHYEKLSLFHNNYTNIYGEVFGGIYHRKWTDKLRVGLAYFRINRDNNYGVTMDSPFGQVASSAYSVIPTLRYQKTWFDHRLRFDQFLVYNILYTNYTDTLRGSYDWYGNFTSIPHRNGEVSADGSLTKLNYKNLISRTNVSFRLNSFHKVEFNAMYSHITRVGSNPFGDVYTSSGKDVLSFPAKYEKQVLALGLKSLFLEGRFTSDLLLKFFRAKGQGYKGSYASEEENRAAQTIAHWGIGEAVKYSLSEHSFIRLSGESTVRLPEQSELFGDGAFVGANFLLKPERSYNFNLGISSFLPAFKSELNLFYRRTYDLILLVNTGVLGKYQNINKVKGLGVEFDAEWRLFRRFHLSGNFTYQDFRLFGQQDPVYEGARLRNTPYFFANLSTDVHFDNVIRKQDRISVYWNYGFVREYYLNYIPQKYEPQGFLGLWGKPGVNVNAMIIPDQNLHSAGCTWQLNPAKILAIGLEMKNIFNADIFDNYRIQNAGRSVCVKINFAIQ